MAFDPMAMFQAGKDLGKSNKSPANYGADNLMDQFTFNRQLGAQAGVQGALEDYKQQLQTKYEPQRKKAELETEYGLKRQFTGNLLGQLGIGSGDASTSQDASKPAQTGAMDQKKNPIQAASKGSYMVKSLNPMTGDLQLGNTAYDAAQKQAEIEPAIQQKQLQDSGTEAMGAIAMKRQLDKMRDLYEGAMSKLPQKGFGSRADVSQTGIGAGLNASMATYAQKKALDMQGKSNPQWIAYQAAIPEFAQLAERGLYGARGRQVNQLVQQEKLAFPGGTGTKQSDEEQWNLFHQNADAPIQMYDSLHQKYLGAPSPINYKSKYDQPNQDSSNLNSNPIQKAASKGKFKLMKDGDGNMAKVYADGSIEEVEQ